MESTQSNTFVRFAQSFYSFEDYPKLARTKTGKVFLHILLLTCIVYVISFIIPMIPVFPYLAHLNPDSIERYVPAFEVKKGVFHIDEHVLYEDLYGSFIFEATSESMSAAKERDISAKYRTAILVHRDGFFFKSLGSVDAYAMSDIPDLSKDILYDLLPYAKVLVVLIFLFAFIFNFISYLFGTLVCTLLANFINLFIKAPILFGSTYALVVYARTMPVLLSAVISLVLPFEMPIFFFYLFVVLYEVFALKAVKEEHDAMSSDPRDSIVDV